MAWRSFQHGILRSYNFTDRAEGFLSCTSCCDSQALILALFMFLVGCGIHDTSVIQYCGRHETPPSLDESCLSKMSWIQQVDYG